ncbi:MAG: thioredoxin family protein [Akkermansia sp.]
MKFQTFIPIFAAVACVAPSLAADVWLTDIAEAQKKAAAENKLILMDFTGSDWCHYCQVIKKDVFDKEEFQKPASEQFVLLELDFPNTPGKQTPEVKQKNKVLAEKYEVRGFPTIIFADATGRPVDSFSGALPMDQVKAKMTQAIEKNKTITAAIKKADAATGDAKIDALVEVLKLAPSDYKDGFYSDIKEEIIKLDVNDKKGLKAADGKAKIIAAQEQELMKHLATIPQEKAQNPEFIMNSMQEYLKKDGLIPETKQKINFVISQVLMSEGKLDDALVRMDEAYKLAPTTKEAEMIKEQKEMIEANKDKIKEMIEAKNQEKAKGEVAPAPASEKQDATPAAK